MEIEKWCHDYLMPLSFKFLHDYKKHTNQNYQFKCFPQAPIEEDGEGKGGTSVVKRNKNQQKQEKNYIWT